MKKMKNKNRGLTLSQIKKAVYGEKIERKESQKLSNKIVKDNKKPVQKVRGVQSFDQGLLLNLPFYTMHESSIYPTPNWFTNNNKVDISVVLPIYRNNCFDLIENWDFFNDGIKTELIFVDDNCPDSSFYNILNNWKKRIEEIKNPIGKIIKSNIRQGWGACCNIGANFALGKILIFLNPDSKIFPNWATSFIRLLQKDDISVVGGLEINELNDSVSCAGLEWSWDDLDLFKIGEEIYCQHKLKKPFSMSNVPLDIFQSCERNFLSSNFLGISKNLFLDIGGFNANIFTKKWSDADFCLRLKEKNKKIIYSSNCRIYTNKNKKDSCVFEKFGKAYFLNHWVSSGRINNILKNNVKQKKQIKNILLKRQDAHGDVLVAASVAAALKKKYENCKIIFSTNCVDVLKENPWIDVVLKETSDRFFDLYYNLDMVYEYRPKTHFLDSYADFVGVDKNECKFFLKTEPFKNSLPDKYIVIHAGNSFWAGRGWSKIKFDQICKKLKEQNFQLICVGTKSDYLPTLIDIDLRGQTSIYELADIIKNCFLFVGTDSFPMVISDIFNVSGVAFFGSILPSKRLINSSVTPIFAEGLDCLGCHHRKPLPCVSTTICEKGIQECINDVSVNYMWEKILEKINANNKTIIDK